jgi:hypothetical protein
VHTTPGEEDVDVVQSAEVGAMAFVPSESSNSLTEMLAVEMSWELVIGLFK